MNIDKLNIIKNNDGFIAALDQSGGSSGKTLKLYGIFEDSYKNDEEMFNLIHDMRTRVIKSKSFTNDKIIGVILFLETINRKIDNKFTSDYLWEEKNIVSFLKIDKGLMEESDGVQLMKDIPDLEEVLDNAVNKNIFGTKMRSVIKSANEDSLVYCPKNPFIAKGSTYYKKDIEWCSMEIIGRFNNDGIEYFVLNGDPGISGHSGLAVYDGLICVAHAKTEFAFLGCASAEIAEHFGKYFGMLITEAKYGDLDGFEIIDSKYGNA